MAREPWARKGFLSLPKTCRDQARIETADQTIAQIVTQDKLEACPTSDAGHKPEACPTAYTRDKPQACPASDSGARLALPLTSLCRPNLIELAPVCK